MSWTQLRKAVCEKTGMREKDVNVLLRAWLNSMKEALARGEEVHLSRLGTFWMQKTAPRKSVDVTTGEEILIGESERLSFAMSAGLREQVNAVKSPRLIAGNDPIRKLGEQANEIIDILADLGQEPNTSAAHTEEEPEMPESLEEPEEPEMPEELEEPEMPESPEEPEMPKSPEEPEIPESLEEPEISESQEKPEIPETPEKPESLKEPESPEEPEKEPEIPEKPEEPEKKEKHTTVEKKRPLWVTALLTLIVFLLLLLFGVLFFQRQLVKWVDMLHEKTELTEKHHSPKKPASTTIPTTTESTTTAQETAATPKAGTQEPELKGTAIKEVEVHKAEAQKAESQEAEVKKAESTEAVAAKPAKAEQPAQTAKAEKAWDGYIETVKLAEGSRLALLADRYYGERELWVYIFEANRDRIKHPNDVPIGTEIRIPRLKAAYSDLSKPENRARVEQMAQEYLNL